MKIVKIRRVGNSNVVSLPRELEHLGYTAGTSVMIEELDGELRIMPASRVRDLIRAAGRRVIAEDQQALHILAEHERDQEAVLHERTAGAKDSLT